MQAIKENKDNKQQPKNKKRMDIIREKLKDLSHNFFRNESKEIRKNFVFNTKLFTKNHHTLLYTLFIFIINKKITSTIYNFFSKIFSRYSINNGRYKIKDLYLPKEELKDIIQLVAKKRNIKNYKSKSSDRLYKIFKKQSKNKKRIDDIRDELKDPTYNISKSEIKDIKRTLYNIDKKNIVG